MIRSAAAVAWRALLIVLTYVSIAIVLINMQPTENVNPDPALRAVERIAFGFVAGLLTVRILRRARNDTD